MSSVRVRTTVAAVAVVALALLIGGVALVGVLRARLADDVRTTAELRARDVASLLESGASPSQLVIDGDDELLVQVLDADGDVVAASPLMDGEPAVARIPSGTSIEVDVPIDDDRFLAVAEAVRGRDYTVLVARTLEAVDESTNTVTQLLLFGCPLLLALVGATTWKVAGIALRPVDAIRAEVDEISVTELHRRVPHPGGKDEIARLAATMNRMLDRLEQSHAQQRRFVSDASHELRSPVASIRQHAELAIAHPDRTSVPELAAVVLGEDLRIQGLVDDLLLLARRDEGVLELRRQPVDLDDIVFEEARRLRETTALQIDTSAVSAGRVTGDGAALRRVVRNVADNAARHGAGRVAFSLSDRDGAVVLLVDDDGPGIPIDERDRVFERFVRLDDARARDAGGSGLGLAIVAELVAAHAGTVTIGSSASGGTRIALSFSGGSAAP